MRLAYLNVFCSSRHRSRRMYFIGFLGSYARYRCPRCGKIKSYKLIYGQIRRIA